MPQGDYIDRHRKRNGYPLDYFERKRKRDSRQVHKNSHIAQNTLGAKGKRFAKKRYAERAQMKKTLAMHEESLSRRKVDDDVREGAVPAYLLDRETTQRAKVLSITVKQKRKEKAGKWDVPLPKVRPMPEDEMFRVMSSGKRKTRHWKRMVTKATFVGPSFTRKHPKYERFIRPSGLRFTKAYVTHPELKCTFQLEIIGVKKNPNGHMYTSLGVMTRGTIVEVNVSELGLVTPAGKVVWGKYAQITNNPENDGKRAFIAGIADDNGYGWAIAKSLAAAGAEILVGTWVPALNIFESSLRRGKFDESRVLPDGSLMEITKVYPLDAVFDCPEDVPEDIKSNKRYAGSSKWTVKEVAETVKEDFGSIDILVHSLANGPEVVKPLLETSRYGYLAAISASSYSFVSLLRHFIPIMNPGGSTISLTYIASERIIPGYGGGMSSAKSALESDTRVLAFEAGRKNKIRVNTISAGPLRSRAAKAIGFIDMMIDYSSANAPLQKELSAEEVGNAAAFLASPLASAITGTIMYVDNGLNAMGVGVDSPVFTDLNIPTSN